MYNIAIQDPYLINQNKLNINFQLNKGELTLLSGANGIGKSSLIEIIKNEKDQFFGQEQVTFMDQVSLKPLNEVSLQDALRVISPYVKGPNPLALDFVSHCLSFSDKPIKNLSGGQNQMVKIALSLSLGGEIFFFDEPSQFLDKKNLIVFKNCLISLKKQNKVICIVEHRSEYLAGIVDQFLHLSSENTLLELDCGH